MNLRILKKLSKRAAPLLPVLGDRREQFRSEKHDNYHGYLIKDRKHWERGRSTHADTHGDMIKRAARDGQGWVYARPPHHPRKGTVMVGAVSGYYEPEWDEECAWKAFEDFICAHFTDWEADPPKAIRRLRMPSDILRAAAELIHATGD